MKVGDNVQIVGGDTKHTGKVGTVAIIREYGVVNIGVKGLFTDLSEPAWFSETELSVVKLYNVGFDTPAGDKVGVQVFATHMDDAIMRGRDRLVACGYDLAEGSMCQRRDVNGGNEYFDRTYTYFGQVQ